MSSPCDDSGTQFLSRMLTQLTKANPTPSVVNVNLYNDTAAHFGNSYSILPPDTTESDLASCLAALCASDPRHERLNLVKTKGPRVEGTCEWITSTEQYQNWNNSSSSQFLRIIGDPGKGKTMISIFLVEKLENPEAEKLASGDVIIQYFCTSNDGPWNTDTGILRGWIYQLLWKNKGLLLHILRPYQVELQRRENAKAKKEPVEDKLFTNFGALWDIFEKMLLDHKPGRVYCVLDGLDECDKDSIKSMLSAIHDLFKRVPCEMTFKAILVSRPLSEDSPESLKLSSVIQLEADLNPEAQQNDLELFITSRVSELFPKVPKTSPLLMGLQASLREKSEGIFLWVSFAVKEMEGKTPSQAKDVLVALPRRLNAMYSRMLLRIPPEEREMAARLLQWIVLGAQPLTLSELCEAVSMEWEELGSREVAVKVFVDRCGYIFVPTDDTVRLVHHSAKDYLMQSKPDDDLVLDSFRIVKGSAHAEIAQRCIEYLQAGCLEDGRVIGSPQRSWEGALAADVVKLGEHPLLSYSVLQWPIHARYSDADLFDFTNAFFAKESKVRDRWWASYKYVQHPPESTHASLLHLAAYFGMHVLARKLLLERGAVVDSKGSDGWTPLSLAAAGGHEAVAWLLLEAKADVNAQGGYYGTALHVASVGGHEKVVELLLKAGADVNAQGGYYGTALHVASVGGHEKVVELLLKAGADVNAQGGYYDTALHVASVGGHEKVVKLLLGAGACVNAQDGNDCTALHAASVEGHEKVVKLLLSARANVNTQGRYNVNAQGPDDGDDYRGRYSTALQAASAGGHEKVVKLLLGAGAPVNARGGGYGTALQAASAGGHEKVVELLLGAGAGVGVNAQGVYYGTALQAASDGGHEKVVKLLLKAGADVNAQGGYYGTALHVASVRGHEKVVKLLLEAGASVNAQGGRYGTALQAASAGGHEKVVELLLGAGAGVNAQGDGYSTALQAASDGGHKKVVKLLLKAGADVNAQGGYYGTALQAASDGGHEKVVKLLLKAGADVNAQGGYYGTALHVASVGGHEKVVELLLKAGADVNAQGDGYSTALQAALAGGHEKVVELLLGAGAGVNAQGDGYSTALQAASVGGHEKVLGKGAVL